MRRRHFVGMASALALAGCKRGIVAAGLPLAGAPSVTAHTETPEGPTKSAGTDPYGALRGFCDGVAAPTEAEFAARRARVVTRLGDREGDAVLVEPGANMVYLTGVRWGLSERPFLLVLGRDGELGWVCPAFEERRAREQLGDAANLRLWQEHEDPFAAALAHAGRRHVGVDGSARGFIYSGLRQAAGKGATRISLGAPSVVRARMRKSTGELARLRRANEATKAAIGVAAARLRPGVRQSEFAQELKHAQQAAGLDSVWALVLFGPSAAFPHGTAEDRALARGELVLVDTGGSLHGYRSDISRTFAPGGVALEVRTAWDVVVEAQAAAMDRIRVGAACSEPDAAARAVIEKAGFGAGYAQFTHRLGHGIGLSVHEPPYLRPENPQRLEVGMTMSNEPGLYRPGGWGIRIEDIVAVTEDAPELFGPAVGPPDDPLAGHAPT